jgi:formylglycine-generating enzyme
MVSGFKTVRVSGVVLSLGALFALSQGCSKLVGIEDTQVGDGGEANAAGNGGGGKGGGAGKASTGGSTSGGASVGGGAGRANATGGSAGIANATGGTGGGSGGMPGSGGTTGGTTGGDAGTGTGGSSGGTTGGGAGTSSSGTAGSGDAGSGGAPDGCGGLTERCTNGAHEVCTDGAWEESPCPLDTPTCEGDTCIVRGPTMVKVSEYYIDGTEVTVAQYAEFVNAKAGDTSGQIGNCGWNDTYVPLEDPGVETWPVSYVDWCDAAAYCKWADKHLCGRIDRAQLTVEELTIANDSQWFRACGGPSGAKHPNTNAVCNSNDGFDNVAPVGSYEECEGYYPGIFDMEGNVAEWVDLCEGTGGATDICYALGGSVVDSQSYCDQIPYDFPRDGKYFTTGFRCCSG